MSLLQLLASQQQFMFNQIALGGGWWTRAGPLWTRSTPERKPYASTPQPSVHDLPDVPPLLQSQRLGDGALPAKPSHAASKASWPSSKYHAASSSDHSPRFEGPGRQQAIIAPVRRDPSSSEPSWARRSPQAIPASSSDSSNIIGRKHGHLQEHHASDHVHQNQQPNQQQQQNQQPKEIVDFISQQISQATMLGQLRRLMLRYKANMEAVHVSTLLYTLQHIIHEQQTAALNPATAAQRLLAPQRYSHHPGTRLKPSATSPEHLSSATSLSNSIPPPSAILPAHSTPYTETDGPTQQLVAQMLGELGAMAWHFLKAHEMQAADIATALYSWAQLHWHPEPGLLAQAEKSFLTPSCLQSAKPLDLVRATWGFSALGHLQPGVLESLTPWVLAALPSLGLEELAELAEAVAFAGVWEEHGVVPVKPPHHKHRMRHQQQEQQLLPRKGDSGKLLLQMQQLQLLMPIADDMVEHLQGAGLSSSSTSSTAGPAATSSTASAAAAAGALLRFLLAMHHAGLNLKAEQLQPLALALKEQQQHLPRHQQPVAAALLKHLLLPYLC